MESHAHQASHYSNDEEEKWRADDEQNGKRIERLSLYRLCKDAEFGKAGNLSFQKFWINFPAVSKPSANALGLLLSAGCIGGLLLVSRSTRDLALTAGHSPIWTP